MMKRITLLLATFLSFGIMAQETPDLFTTATWTETDLNPSQSERWDKVQNLGYISTVFIDIYSSQIAFRE